MFDIGFFELLLISVVGLLVFGPEQFLDAIRTTALWTKRIRRSFDDVRAEVQRELHNDQVLRDLRESTDKVQQQFRDLTDPLEKQLSDTNSQVRETFRDIEASVAADQKRKADVTDAETPAIEHDDQPQPSSGGSGDEAETTQEGLQVDNLKEDRHRD